MFKSFLLFLFLFLYLALPAILSLEAVSRLGGLFWFFGLSWACSILFLVFFVFIIPRDTKTACLGIYIVTLSFAFLNTALAISFLTQGVPFNTAFFTHLDVSTLKISLATDGTRMVGAATYVVLTPFIVAWCASHLSTADRTWTFSKSIATILLCLAVLSNYPIQSLTLHKINTRQSSERMLSELQSLSIGAIYNQNHHKQTRNLILIYLEGVEQNYLDQTLFPNLTPRLEELRSTAIWFDNVHQFPGTGWTIGGLVASQCGLPLLSNGHGNQILASVDNPFRQIPCLAEFLKVEDYRTIFLGGATLNFAGKGQFLIDNGYDLTLGIDELPKASRHKWGMFDEDLFEHGKELFNGLTATDTPFLLTILTLDTHHPSGTPSPTCAPYAASNETMLNAVHCTDQLVSDFVDHVLNSSAANDTVIAIVSDHLLINGEPIEKLSNKERRISFFIIDPEQGARKISSTATHFDIAPTILESVGIPNTPFPFGHSIIDGQAGKAFVRDLSDEDFDGFKIESLITESNLEHGVVFASNDSRLEVGEANFFARDVTNVHYDISLGGNKEIIALYFDSFDDRYPLIYLKSDELRSDIDTRSSGIVIAASNGGEVCFKDNLCESGHVLAAYNVKTGEVLREKQIKDGKLFLSSGNLKNLSIRE